MDGLRRFALSASLRSDKGSRNFHENSDGKRHCLRRNSPGPTLMFTHVAGVLAWQPIKVLHWLSSAARRAVCFTYGEWAWRCNGCVAPSGFPADACIDSYRIESRKATGRRLRGRVPWHVRIFRLNSKITGRPVFRLSTRNFVRTGYSIFTSSQTSLL